MTNTASVGAVDWLLRTGFLGEGGGISVVNQPHTDPLFFLFGTKERKKEKLYGLVRDDWLDHSWQRMDVHPWLALRLGAGAVPE
jgi:hypothetical protein